MAILRIVNITVMTTKDERLSFLEEMKDVRRIRKSNRAELQVPRELTPGHLERQRAAVAKPFRDANPLTSDMVEPLTANDVLSWQRPGIQNGVFRKLRLGQYPIEARLDLHRLTVEQARKEVFDFVGDCVRYGVRTVIILHGKGERNPDGIALLKSHLARWLPELNDVLAFHSAQKRHGGTGAVYVMVRKGSEDRQKNSEIHGGL